MDHFERIAERAVAAVTGEPVGSRAEGICSGAITRGALGASGRRHRSEISRARAHGGLVTRLCAQPSSTNPDVSGRAEEITRLLNNLPTIRRKSIR